MKTNKISNREVLVKVWEEEIEGVIVVVTRQTTIKNQAPGKEAFFLRGFREPVNKERLLEI